MQLALIAAGIGGGQRPHDVLRRRASRHRLERGRRVEWIDERLRGERAHAARRMGAERSDREEAARDGDAQVAVRIERNDGPGHGSISGEARRFRSAPATQRAVRCDHASGAAWVGSTYAGAGWVKYAWRMW